MRARHYVEDAALLRRVRAAVRLPGVDPEAVGIAMEEWLVKQPTAPALVGATAAAGILGIQPPHLSRLREQGRMPEPIPVEGSVDVYVKEEVQALAIELEAERAERRRKRAERGSG